MYIVEHGSLVSVSRVVDGSPACDSEARPINWNTCRLVVRDEIPGCVPRRTTAKASAKGFFHRSRTKDTDVKVPSSPSAL